MGLLDYPPPLRSPLPGNLPLQPRLGSAMHPPGSLLERSGSLRHDIQRENLKKGHFWSLQLGSGRALAAARARFSFSARISLWYLFCTNLGPQNRPQRFMMATLGGPFAQFGPLLGKTERQIQEGSCAKSGHSWPQTCPKSYANQIFAAFGALTWAYSA